VKLIRGNTRPINIKYSISKGERSTENAKRIRKRQACSSLPLGIIIYGVLPLAHQLKTRNEQMKFLCQ
jgi:hypothetical protein